MAEPNVTRAGKRLGVALFAAVVAAPLAEAVIAEPAAQAQSVGQIIVEGNQRVDDATVRSYLALRSGGPYSAELADESLKALFETGLFSDVRITRRGGAVVVTVVENPIINRVAFEGNRKLKDEVLAQEIQLQPRSVYTRARAQADTQRILEIYRRTGRFGARVEPKLIELPQNRVDVVFEINEAKKTGVRRISFVGNRAFGDGALREVITTGESGFLSFLSSNDIYDPDRLEADQEQLRRFYLRKGYADFRVVSAAADFDPNANGFFITFTVDEGPQYTFGNVAIDTSLPEIDPETLRSLVRTESGEVYNADLVDRTVEALTVEVASRGYAFARVRPSGERDPATNTVSVTYFIEEGPRVYVERLEIRGNTRTLDRVIRREFDLAEGDPLNQVLLDRAERRLRALGYFTNVRVTTAPGSTPDRAVVLVEVEEQPTGEVSFGAGYSTTEGVIGDISITERNLLGRGQVVRLSVSASAQKTTAEFSFTEPRFLDRRVSFGFDLFYRDYDYGDTSSYSSEQRGGQVRFGYLLAEDLSMSVRYRLENEEVIIGRDVKPRNIDVDGDGIFEAPNEFGINERVLSADDIRAARDFPGGPVIVVPTVVSPFILAREGSDLTSSVGTSLVYNKLDFTAEPRNGYYAELNVDLAGLGGDKNYVRSTAEARGYREIYPEVVAVARVTGGIVEGFDEAVGPTDSFFMGPNLVRGFSTAGIGPRAQRRLAGLDGALFTEDDLIEDRDALGGTAYWGATAEVRFPIWGLPRSLGLSGAVFADAGSLFDVGNLGDLPTQNDEVSWEVLDDSSIRASAGVSVIWKSPFGPLRADLALPLAEEEYDRTQLFRFSGGTRF